MSRIDVESELLGIEAMALADLRVAWTRLIKTTPPKVGAGLLRLALAHWIQSKAFGALTKATERRLRETASGRSQPGPTAGTRLVRAWQGKAHVVTIGDDMRVHWNGRDWNSLSEVARAITGTRWSGPAFFGLKTSKRAA
jgi:hypothetical protein